MNKSLYNSLKALKSSDRYPYLIGVIGAIANDTGKVSSVKLVNIQEALEALEKLAKEGSLESQ